MSEATDDEIECLAKGSVIIWKNFEFFETGEKKDSRFLILSDCHSLYHYFLGVRATTKIEFYKKTQSTIERTFIIIPTNKESSFTKKVVIDFNNIRTLYREEIKKGWGKEISKIKPISGEMIKLIEDKVSSSKTIRKDWKLLILKSPKGL